MAISKDAVKALRQIYLDQAIDIVLKGITIMIPEAEGMSISAAISGLCMDIDQDFVYIVEDSGNVKTVGHDTVGVIEFSSSGEDMLTIEMPDELDDVH